MRNINHNIPMLSLIIDTSKYDRYTVWINAVGSILGAQCALLPSDILQCYTF